MTSILDRLNKLRAMATQTTSPVEAAVAIKKLQALLHEHNLTEKDLDRYQIGEVKIKSTQSVSNVKDWEGWIMTAVADAFGGGVLWTSGSSWLYYKNGTKKRNPDPFGYFTLVGFKATLPLMEYTATLLLRAVVDGRRRLNATLPRDMDRLVKTYGLDGYCQGFVTEVAKKIEKLQADPLIGEYVKDVTEGRNEKKAQSRDCGLRGALAGVNDAADFDLHRPMGNEQTLMLENHHD